MSARKGTGGPVKAPPLQDRPAAPAKPRSPEPEFPPNPVVGVRRGPEQPTDREYRVVGPKAVGGVPAPGTVTLCLTDGQAQALESGGHVEPVTETDDQPLTGTDKEGN